MNNEQKKWLKMILVAVALLMAAIAVIEVCEAREQIGKWVIVLYLPAYLLAGGSVLKTALKNIASGRLFDENFLMSLATVGAFCIGEYNEAVAVMIFYQVGELFQDCAVTKARESIQSLMDMASDCANVIVDDRIEEMDIYDVEPGSCVFVKPGERIPLDGVILRGESALDTSPVTGESYPREAVPGDSVFSGSINLTSPIYVKTTKPADESTSAKIMEMVETAIEKKAKKERFITRFARVYTPVVVGLAAAIAFIPPLLFSGVFSEWVSRALIFLVISCPCALVISIPMGFFSGIGAASKRGILVKGGTSIESLSQIDVIGFDKTGTITTGEFRVEKMNLNGVADIEQSEILEMVGIVERESGHPVSIAIVRELGKMIKLDSVKPEEVVEKAGRGLIAKIFDRTVLVGNRKLMDDNGVIISAENDTPGRTSHIHVAVDGRYAGYIELADEVKEDVQRTLREIKSLGVKKTVMLTGDRKEPAEYAACIAGVDDIEYELLPEDKLDKICKLKENNRVAFVGDGINDAPVLAGADVGIAMGVMGTDAAIEVADVVIMDDKMSGIAEAIRISKKTIRIVNSNIVFALGCKGLILGLGAFGLANIWAAVFADVGVAVIAILNSMRAGR